MAKGDILLIASVARSRGCGACGSTGSGSARCRTYGCASRSRGARTCRGACSLHRAERSLAVTQGLVVAMNGLDLVEARPAIYVIQGACVARVDTVGAGAGVHLVVAFAGDDLVVTAATSDAVVAAVAFEAVGPEAALEVVGPPATLEAILTGATLEAVLPVGPDERILACGACEDLRQGFVGGEERSDHNYHHRQQDV